MFDSIFQLKITGKHLFYFSFIVHEYDRRSLLFSIFNFSPLPYHFMCAYVVSMFHLCLLDYACFICKTKKNYVTFLHHIIVLLIRGRTKRNEKMFLFFLSSLQIDTEKI